MTETERCAVVLLGGVTGAVVEVVLDEVGGERIIPPSFDIISRYSKVVKFVWIYACRNRRVFFSLPVVIKNGTVVESREYLVRRRGGGLSLKD